MKSFSSGEVAQICDVTSRTVIRWIEANKIKAFKLPGRGNNRISEAELLNFLVENKMPIPEELTREEENCCVVVTTDEYLCRHARRILRNADYLTDCFESGIEAGFEIAFRRPSLIVLDADLSSASPRQMYAQIEKVADYSPDIIVFSSRAQKPSERGDEHVVFLDKPLSLNAFAQAVDDLSASTV